MPGFCTLHSGDADYIVDRIDAECCRWCKSPVTCQPETLAMTEKTESLRTQPMVHGCVSERRLTIKGEHALNSGVRVSRLDTLIKRVPLAPVIPVVK